MQFPFIALSRKIQMTLDSELIVFVFCKQVLLTNLFFIFVIIIIINLEQVNSTELDFVHAHVQLVNAENVGNLFPVCQLADSRKKSIIFS